MSTFNVILALLLVFPAVSCTCSNPTAVQLCYNVYFQSYELSTNPFPSYRAYKTVREMFLVEKGPVGQTTACNYTNSLITCLGAAVESSCITSDQFGGYFNITEQADATNFVQDYFMMKYTCNQGYDDAMKYFYCLEQVGLYNTDKLINCSETEQQGIANGGGCHTYNTFITCMSHIYTDYCGADIRGYICNLEVSGITGANPTCSGQFQDCSKPAPPSFFSRKETLRQAAQVLNSGRYIFP